MFAFVQTPSCKYRAQTRRSERRACVRSAVGEESGWLPFRHTPLASGMRPLPRRPEKTPSWAWLPSKMNKGSDSAGWLRRFNALHTGLATIPGLTFGFHHKSRQSGCLLRNVPSGDESRWVKKSEVSREGKAGC